MNARTEMQLTQPKQYKELVTIEMSLMANLYLRIKTYSDKLTTGYEAVFYNAHRDITYQNYLIMAAVRVLAATVWRQQFGGQQFGGNSLAATVWRQQ